MDQSRNGDSINNIELQIPLSNLEEEKKFQDQIQDQDGINISKKFECGICQKSYSSLSNLNKHLKNLHKNNDLLPIKSEKIKKSFKCNSCSEIFQNKQELNKHSYSKSCQKSKEIIPKKSLEPSSKRFKSVESNQLTEIGNVILNSLPLKSNATEELNNETLEYRFLGMKIPIFFIIQNSTEEPSPIQKLQDSYRGMIFRKDSCIKLYGILGLMEEQMEQIQLLNEFSILTIARNLELRNVIQLGFLVKENDHIGIGMRRYEMDFRQFLKNHRDESLIPGIFKGIINGISEIHSLGYVHRDLKPENVVLDLDPLEVRIVDFNHSVPCSQSSKEWNRGTELYSPEHMEWQDGSFKWDLYSLGIMILESYLVKDYYFQIQSKRQILNMAQNRIDDEREFQDLKLIIKGTILRPPHKELMSLQEIESHLGQLFSLQSHKQRKNQ